MLCSALFRRDFPHVSSTTKRSNASVARMNPETLQTTCSYDPKSSCCCFDRGQVVVKSYPRACFAPQNPRPRTRVTRRRRAQLRPPKCHVYAAWWGDMLAPASLSFLWRRCTPSRVRDSCNQKTQLCLYVVKSPASYLIHSSFSLAISHL